MQDDHISCSNNLPYRGYYSPPCPPNLPSSDKYNWDYGGSGDGGDFYPSGYDCDDFDGSVNFNVRQPRRRRPIVPRSGIGRPTVLPETATTYKCSFYSKCYSKRCPIWPRNYFDRPCAPLPSCTMNQLSYTYRLGHRFWY